MTQKFKSYLSCSKWTISVSSSANKNVHFTVHLHSVNEIYMSSCQFVCFLFLKKISLSPLRTMKSPEFRNVSSTLANRTLYNIHEPHNMNPFNYIFSDYF